MCKLFPTDEEIKNDPEVDMGILSKKQFITPDMTLYMLYFWLVAEIVLP